MTEKSQGYVRLFDSPKIGIGTILQTKMEYGRTVYLFDQDDRFDSKLRDFWADEGDFGTVRTAHG